MAAHRDPDLNPGSHGASPVFLPLSYPVWGYGGTVEKILSTIRIHKILVELLSKEFIA